MSTRWFSFLLCLSILSISMGSAWSARLPKGMRKNSETVKEISKILFCARNFIEQARGGDEAVMVALIYVKRAQELINDEQLLTELRKACFVEMKEKPPVPDVSRAMLEQKLSELAKSYPASVVQVVSTLINPSGTCRFVSFGVSVGLGISLGIGLKTFGCESQDGRRFIALAPEFSDGVGLGAIVMAGAGDLDLQKLTKGSAIDVYEGRSSTNGLIIVIQKSEGNADVPYVLKEKGVGLGLGFFDMRRKFPMLRVIDRADQFYFLINLLLAP